MREVGSSVTPSDPTRALFWVRQPRRRRYRASAKPAAANGTQSQVHLPRLEQDRDYQRLLTRLSRLSERFQRSLMAEQRRTWLRLEDALLDHAWFLHGYYFKAGYELGKRAAQRRTSDGRQPSRATDELHEQTLLLSAFARLLENLANGRR